MRTFAGICPNCSAQNSFEMLDISGQTMTATCVNCRERFNAHVTSNHTIFTRRLSAVAEVDLDRPSKRKLIAASIAEFSNAARFFLQDTNSWIDPADLVQLVALAITHDNALKASGEARSPLSLQATMLRDAKVLSGAGPSGSSVRRFMKLVFRGRAFQGSHSAVPKFYVVYQNDLDERALLMGYLRSCVYRISQAVEVSADHADEVTKLLLEDRFTEGPNLVKLVIEERTKMPKRQRVAP